MADSTSYILVVNQGSASLKLSLFKICGNSLELVLSLAPKDSVEKALVKNNLSRYCIKAVGHRVVHGGHCYNKPVLITPYVMNQISKFSEMAPLHNPICLQGIRESIHYFGKKIPQVAVFDTAFHHAMKEKAFTYAIPYRLTQKYKIRSYGFHGIAHEALWQAYVHVTKKKTAKIVTVHLGGGCSITAINKGVSVDTSMGFTPLQGLVMETRSGDIDPGLLEYLCIKEQKTIEEVTQMLSRESGLLGVSGVSSKMQDLLSKENSPQVTLAIDLFCYRVIKYIGAYIAVLGGIDALIFSGGIGENAPLIRKLIIKAMKWYGVVLDTQKNRRTVHLAAGEIKKISHQDSNVEVYCVGADENRWIGKQVLKFL